MSTRKDLEEIVVEKACIRYLSLDEGQRTEAFALAVRRYAQALSGRKLQNVLDGYTLQEMLSAAARGEPGNEGGQ